MTSLRKLVESARVTLPQPRFAGYATLFFSLSVLTFVISLAASEASLMAAALCYAIEQLRAPRLGQHSRPALRFPFPPVRLPVGLFCLFTVISVFGAADPAAGWPVVRKLVLFLIMLLTVALPSTSLRDGERSRTVAEGRALQELLYAGLFFASSIAGAVGVFQFAAEYGAVKATHPDQVYMYLSA